MDRILILASIITGLSTIITFVSKLYISISSVENKINLWEETMRKNTLYILKLALFTEGLSITDRIQAGQQYLDIKRDYIVEKK